MSFTNNKTKPGAANKSKPEKKKIKRAPKSYKIPRTVQETIPYYSVYENDGIIETEKGTFSKSFLLQDINYEAAKIEDQQEMFLRYGELLNAFDSSVKFQITINNRNISDGYFEDKVKVHPKGDCLDEFREELNTMLKDKMTQGRNDIKREKYITISVEAPSVIDARNQFSRMEVLIKANIKNIGGSSATPLSSLDRLKILHDFYNIKSKEEFGAKAKIWNRETKIWNNDSPDSNDEEVPDSKYNEITNFDFDSMRRAGLSTKDMIGPMSFSFQKDHFEMGDMFGRALFLTSLPTFLRDDLVIELSAQPINMMISINYEAIPQLKALRLVGNQITNINANVQDKQRKASSSGYSIDTISPDLMAAQEDAKNLLSDLTTKNQKMFQVTFVLVHLADSLDQLNQDTKLVQDTVARYICQLKNPYYQQELALTAALPLAENKLALKRTLTTESASVFIPFSTQELAQNNGMYYGLNATSRNMILFNRKESKNTGGWYLGTPGSGKSFQAKREMIEVLLSTDDDVIVIDPEKEYLPMAKLLGGEVVNIAPGSENHINPMDMDMDYSVDEHGVNKADTRLKTEFILSICETIMSANYGITEIQKSIVDRCVKLLYADFLKAPSQDNIPTLKDFQQLLAAQREPEAKSLATAFEIYSTGSLDAFAYKTNVDTDARFLVYNISDIGNNMKTLGMLIVLDAVWNRIIANRKKGRRTWVYIDEIYLLFTNVASATFLKNLFKRARKWGAVPTGITQNVEDILASDIACSMLSNAEFVMMLNQATMDREQLTRIFNISSTQLGYITNAAQGEGLIYTGSSLIPFRDEFPKNTKLYQAMTTKPEEMEQV